MLDHNNIDSEILIIKLGNIANELNIQYLNMSTQFEGIKLQNTNNVPDNLNNNYQMMNQQNHQFNDMQGQGYPAMFNPELNPNIPNLPVYNNHGNSYPETQNIILDSDHQNTYSN